MCCEKRTEWAPNSTGMGGDIEWDEMLIPARLQCRGVALQILQLRQQPPIIKNHEPSTSNHHNHRSHHPPTIHHQPIKKHIDQSTIHHQPTKQATNTHHQPSNANHANHYHDITPTFQSPWTGGARHLQLRQAGLVLLQGHRRLAEQLTQLQEPW